MTVHHQPVVLGTLRQGCVHGRVASRGDCERQIGVIFSPCLLFLELYRPCPSKCYVMIINTNNCIIGIIRTVVGGDRVDYLELCTSTFTGTLLL